MPVITSIKQQNRQNRVNVYLDDEFGFGISLDDFVLEGLRVEQSLTPDEIEKLKNTSDFGKNLEKVYRFAMVRPRSEKEFIDYFRRKKIDSTFHLRILKKLKHLSFLDDAKFAKWWVDQRIKTKSVKIIKLELQQKGIDRNIIDDVFGEVVVDEEKLAKNLLEKKAYKWEGLEPRLTRQKMSQYLVGKGFNWDVINNVIARSVTTKQSGF